MPIATLVVAAAGATVLGAGVILALRSALHAVLWELCVFEHRARFWVRACMIEFGVGLLLAGAIGASTTTAGQDPVATVSSLLRWETGGAIVGLAVVALVVLRESSRSTRSGPLA